MISFFLLLKIPPKIYIVYYSKYTNQSYKKRADRFVFYTNLSTLPGILKKDEKIDIALAQIKEKEYVQKFKSENNEVLAVAICYDSKTKKHSCKIERLQ